MIKSSRQLMNALRGTFGKELMICPKGGKERLTPHYSVQRHLTLNDYHTFLLWNYTQVGSFPLWSLREGFRRARFRLIVGRSEAKAIATKQKASPVVTKELAYLLSRLCIVDATTMRVCVVNGQVVPPFAEGATLP